MQDPSTVEKLWPHVKSLSEEEYGALLDRARKDWRYRAQGYAAYGAMLLGLCLGPWAIVRAFEPALPIRLVLIGLVILCILLGVQLFLRLNVVLYCKAVLRQVSLKYASGRPN
jgi:hypothetical protein